MIDSEEETIIISCLLIDEEEKNRKRRRARFWQNNICKKRLQCGEFYTLYPELVEDNVKFFQYFRMSHEKFTSLLCLLEIDLTRMCTSFRESIGPKERLAVCLRFLATGNSFRSLASKYRLGDRTVREIVYSTCDAIWKKIQPIAMPEPTEAMWMQIEKDFSNKWNFPNLIGAIDGKHVLIHAPPHSESLFYRYKKTFSVAMMCLVDANDKFITVDVGTYGKNSDGSIFKNSNLGRRLSTGTLQVPPSKRLPGSDEVLPHVIVGDEAFPLCKYLMRPYCRDRVQDNEEKKVFNYRVSRPRNVSKNAFRILVRKFRIFERQLCLSHEHLNSVVLATCCLHNYLRDDCCQWTENDLNISVSDMKGLQDLERIGGNSSSDATNIRDHFKNYFNSEMGSVP